MSLHVHGSSLQLCDGASPEERKAWKLTQASDYYYLNQSTCYELPGVNNTEEYKVSWGLYNGCNASAFCSVGDMLSARCHVACHVDGTMGPCLDMH